MRTEDYIFEKFCEYNHKYNDEIKDRTLTKRMNEAKEELIKLLNEEQYRAFVFFDNCNLVFTLEERKKFYEAGFITGYHDESELSFEEYEQNITKRD